MWRWTWWGWRRLRRRRSGPAAAAAAAAALATAGFLLLVLRSRGSVPDAAPPPEQGPPPPDRGLLTWVVVDAAGGAGAQVCSQVAGRYPGWTVLIYGMNKPDQNSLSRCLYMPAAVLSQDEGIRVLPPPINLGPGRRAFLHAIKNGAEAIYVPAAGDRGKRAVPQVFTKHSYHGLVYSSPSRFFDGLAHFGCRLPSGVSFPATGESGSGSTYRLCGPGSPPALQVLPRLPVPLSFEVHQEGTDRKTRIPSCDRRAPPVTLGHGVLADIRLREALYLRAAFWALGVLPEVNSSGAGVLVAGYALQRLLGMAGGQVLMRSDHTPEGDDQTTSARRPYTNKAIQAIRQWTCAGGNNRLIQCARELFNHLGALHLLERRLVDSLALWWDALEAIDYSGPRIELGGIPAGRCKKDRAVLYPADLRGPVSWRQYRSRPALPLANEQLTRRTLTETCSRLPEAARTSSPYAPPVNLTHSWVQFDSVLLLVTFNLPYYQVIPYIELLYRPFFPYMVYCGPGVPDLKRHPELARYRFNFVSYGGTPEGHFPGSFNYECMSMVMRMGFSVDGYLVISDDMYLSLSRLTELSLQQAWFLPREKVRIGDVPTLKGCRLGMCDFALHWRWWEDYQKQLLSTLAFIKAGQRDSRTLYRCHNQLVSVTGGEKRALGAESDIFFLPERLAAEYAAVSDVFLANGVFLEIAVPTTLWCLERPEKMETINGLMIWDESREDPNLHFNKREYLGKTFLHPTKWSGLAKGDRSAREFYCNRLLPHLHDPYGRMTG